MLSSQNNEGSKLKNFISHIKSDAIAGLQVSLIALPLSIGIAIASGFPPMAGILAAIVGGVLVSRISGTHLTINGPAAGLIVVILTAVDRLGAGDMAAGYRLTLAAIVCAGLLQIIFGIMRVGRLSVLFPSSVIHGMMAAIGLTIIVKQLPVIMGVTPISKSAVGQLIELPMIIVRANPAVTLIGLASLFVLLMYDTMKGAWKRWMPAPIAAVAVATSFAAFFGFGSSESYQMLGKTYSLGTKYLVNLPQNVFSTLGAPDFSHLGSREFLIVVLTIALVGSLETLLSAAAVERLDPDRRRSDLDKDLLAVGVGTAVSGLAGGLPMIAEIVRSSANVNAGAKSGWANFFHGVYLLAAILFFPAILRHVPLAALAALLVFTGYRLASPMELVKVKRLGSDQLAIFLTTMVVSFATDLLMGVGSGILLKILLHLLRQVPVQRLVRPSFLLSEAAREQVTVKINKVLIFTNVLPVLNAIEALPKTAHVTIDLREASFVDLTATERLQELQRVRTIAGGKVDIKSPVGNGRSLMAIVNRRIRN